jgi:septal ring factor EnvC (AmiA/AmiB activator)
MRRCLASLCLLCAPLVLAQNAPEAAELERLNAAIAKVQEQLAGTRSTRSSLVSEVEASEKAILDLQRRIQSGSALLAQQQSELGELRSRQQQLEGSRLAQQNQIAAYVKSAWITGDEEYLKLLLNQQDPLQSARMRRYYAYFSAARASRIADYSRTLTELAVGADAIVASTRALARQQAGLAEQELALAASQQQRRQALGQLDRELATRGEELARLEMEKIEIEVLLEELRQSIADIPLGDDQEPFAERKGLMRWPLDGRLVNRFGTRHPLGDLTWEGITIAAPAGSDIRAIHHGRVVFADWFNSSGLLLIIDHGGGYMSLHAHNQELYKAVGEWVTSGDVVAAAGNTGGQQDAGLYFEIRRNGRAEDPVNWLVPRQ